MKRIATIIVVGGVGLWAALLVMQLAVGDPEPDNIAFDEDLPEFYASDPTLLKPNEYRIQERFPAADGWRSGAETPYFIQLSDGRYACGYTDAEGKTATLFTHAKVEHRVFWDEEAESRWTKVRPRRNR